MDISEELADVIRDVFENHDLQITQETIATNVDGWDSFSHIYLIRVIETHFGIEFTQREALSFKNVGDLINLIKEKVISKRTSVSVMKIE
jgi:acyl carrier protein